MDASHFKMHLGARAEPVLCAWGITGDGKPVMLALDGMRAESTDVCLRFLRDLMVRGLRPPPLMITDGAPGATPRLDCCSHRDLPPGWKRATIARTSATR